MNKRLGNLLMGATLTGALLLSAAGWAMGPVSGGAHDPQRMLSHMSDRLGLSDEQQAEIETLMTSSREVTAPDQKRLRALRQELRAQEADFNPEKTREMATEIGVITGRLVYQATSTKAEVQKLLTDEQKAKMDEFHARREARHERRGKGGNRDSE